MIPNFLIISLFQTLIYIDDIPKNYPSKFHQYTNQSVWKTIKTIFWESKTSLDRPILQLFPSKPLNIHHLGWSGFPGPSQKLHLQDHPIRLRQWQLRTLCLFRSSQNLGFGQGVPPTEWSECLLKLYIYIYLFIYIYMYLYIYIYYVCIYIHK